MHNTKSLVKEGFTLVELLVVIAIIGTLISILLPSLSRARATATRVACSSNQRQTGLAILSFASDHKGRMLPFFLNDEFRKDYGNYDQHWIRIMHKLGYIDGPIKWSADEPGLKNRMLYCPVNNPPGHALWHHSYGLREWFGKRVHYYSKSPRGSNQDLLKIDIVPDPSSFFLLSDSINYNSGIQWYSLQTVGGATAVHFRHNKKANTMFLDGSVRAQDDSYFRALPENDPDFSQRPFGLADENGVVYMLPW